MTDVTTTTQPLLDLYPVGKMPPAYHVPKTMWGWAIRKERHGRPLKAMQLEVLPTPEIDGDEVLLLVMAAGVNYNGIWAGLGEPVSVLDGYKQDYAVVGSDASGIVWVWARTSSAGSPVMKSWCIAIKMMAMMRSAMAATRCFQAVNASGAMKRLTVPSLNLRASNRASSWRAPNI